MVPSFMLHHDLPELFESAIRDPDRTVVPALDRGSVEQLQSRLLNYRISAGQLDRFRDVLSAYQGTHPFHNFTKGMAPLEDRSRRFIETFQALDPVVLSGFEWIPTEVVGQSFLLHQIRKMIGLALRVARKSPSTAAEAAVTTTAMDDLEHALSSPDSVHVPTAPAQGLFLDMSLYGGYNHRKGLNQGQHRLPDIAWGRDEGTPAHERYRSFRDRVVQHIGKQEREEANFLQYLFREFAGRVAPAASAPAGPNPSSDTDRKVDGDSPGQ
jgi:hypothetical protein